MTTTTLPQSITSGPDLDDFIMLANLCADQHDLPEPLLLQPQGQHRGLLTELANRFEEQFPKQSQFHKTLVQAARQSGITVWKDRVGVDGTTWRVSDIIFLYDLFFAVRKTLLRLIERIGGQRDARNKSVTVGSGAFWTALSIRADGTIDRAPDIFLDGFIKSLIGKDANRVRKCPIETCRKIFWAQRKDRSACSPRCLNINRVRKSRMK